MKTAKEILTSHNKFHITLGLERISKILEILGNPQNAYKIIHIAGTNGKGSTSKIIDEILNENFKGEKNIGLYTSPHMFSYCERIKVNKEDISEEIFNRLISNIDDLAKKNDIDLSEFELLTACAFYYFYIKKADYVVLETGLGGLFDATNVCNSIIEVITTIDFDHTERLGSTINEIAAQKAGIIKNNSKVIISKDNLGFEVIKKTSKEKNATLILALEPEFKIENGETFIKIDNDYSLFNLKGRHQLQNLALALATVKNLDIKIKDETIKSALKKVTWGFRLEYIKEKNLLLDGAHNPSGIKVLADYIKTLKPQKKVLIFGCLKNKDYKKMIEILKPCFDLKQDELYFYEFDYPNSLKFKELDDELSLGFKPLKTLVEVDEVIKKDCLKIFCGSLYMLSVSKNEV